MNSPVSECDGHYGSCIDFLYNSIRLSIFNERLTPSGSRLIGNYSAFKFVTGDNEISGV